MKIAREDDRHIVTLRITFDEAADPMTGWLAYRVTCAAFEVSADGHRGPPRARMGLLSIPRDATPAEMLTYACEIAAVAGIAATLESEMRRKYKERFGPITTEAQQ